VIAAGETLRFTMFVGPIEVGFNRELSEADPVEWLAQSELEMAPFAGGDVRVFARSPNDGCDTRFNAVYRVEASYPPAASDPLSTAVQLDDARILGWASEVVDFQPGEGLADEWSDSTQALGAAEGTALDVVSLGRGGVIVLGFDRPIADGQGADFAVFENSFSETFLELAFVEVSSDGALFVRFDVAYSAVDGSQEFSELDTSDLGQFAGKYQRGAGTPFDLAVLRQHPEVSSGQVDLTAITHVRLLDIVGDGSVTDSFGRPIYDPYPTAESVGFDLDAVAVLNGALP